MTMRETQIRKPVCGTIEQASRRWRGGGRDAKLIAARRRLAEIHDREDHERDVEAGVPVTIAAAIVDASVPAEEEDRNDNYVEDLGEDVGPGDRGVRHDQTTIEYLRAD